MPLQAPEEAKKYTTAYSDFRGVDFTNDPTNVWKRRSPTGLNMSPDMSGRPWKRTGWTVELTAEDFAAAYKENTGADYAEEIEILNLYSFTLGGQDHLIVFCNCGVFAYTGGVLTHLLEDREITSNPYRGFYFEGGGTAGFYFYGGFKLYGYLFIEATDTFVCEDIDTYIPTIMIGRSPSGGGTIYDAVNILSGYRTESFLGDSSSKQYYVTSTIADKTDVTIKVRDDEGTFVTLSSSDYTVSENSITFTEAHPPVNIGEDNVQITYPATTESKTAVEKAFFDTKAIALFGTGIINSVFVSGCDDDNYASRVWYSQVGDPTYFPDLNYLEIGSNDTKIMGLTKVGEYLGVIKQGNTTDSTIYLAYPTTFEDDTTYAAKQSVSGIGAISRNCFDILGDETLFLSSEGIMAIVPSSNENERQTKNRSYYINKKLLSEKPLSEAFSYVWNGLYIACINSHCYVLDGAQKSSWVNEKTNLQYECYYWDNVPAVCFGQYEDDLWFADRTGNLCRFKTYEKDGMAAYNDNGEAIQCEWSTILDNDGATNFFKNLQKKGCLVTILPMEKTGAKVYVRADDKEPVEIGEITSENATVPQEFYLNKKVKKYKRLQIIVKNDAMDEGLGVQEIIKIYTLGNYSKNRSVKNDG